LLFDVVGRNEQVIRGVNGRSGYPGAISYRCDLPVDRDLADIAATCKK